MFTDVTSFVDMSYIEPLTLNRTRKKRKKTTKTTYVHFEIHVDVYGPQITPARNGKLALLSMCVLYTCLTKSVCRKFSIKTS